MLDDDFTADSDGTSDWSWDVMFQGLKWDDVTGDYYARNRYYGITTARFGSRDPVGYPDGLNAYEAEQSSPTVKSDPYGLQTTAPATAPATRPSLPAGLGYKTIQAPKVGDVKLNDFTDMTWKVDWQPDGRNGAVVQRITIREWYWDAAGFKAQGFGKAQEDFQEAWIVKNGKIVWGASDVATGPSASPDDTLSIPKSRIFSRYTFPRRQRGVADRDQNRPCAGIILVEAEAMYINGIDVTTKDWDFNVREIGPWGDLPHRNLLTRFDQNLQEIPGRPLLPGWERQQTTKRWMMIKWDATDGSDNPTLPRSASE